MIKKKPLFLIAAVILAWSPARAQSPAAKPLTESELLKQIEVLNSGKVPATPSPATRPLATPPAIPPGNPLFNPAATPGNILKPSPGAPGAATGDILKPSPGAPGAATGDKKEKGPTEITALEATFDQKANVAVFIGSVVVKDPEFNVVCDKLTAYLKHEDKSASANGTAPKATPKPATSTPDGAAAKKKGGGLDHAIAITTSDRRVIITQDKVEADGTVTHGIGKSDMATYDAVTGNIVLTGSPDVTQGMNRCIATDPDTVMTLNRDGHMTAKGPHRTIIQSDEDRAASKGNTQ